MPLWRNVYNSLMPSGICTECWLMNHRVAIIKKKATSPWQKKIHFTQLRFTVKIHAHIFKITNAIMLHLGFRFVNLWSPVVRFLFQVPQNTNKLLLATLLKDHSHFTDGNTEAEGLTGLTRGGVRLHSHFPWLSTPAAGPFCPCNHPAAAPLHCCPFLIK